MTREALTSATTAASAPGGSERVNGRLPKLLVVTLFAPGGHHGGAICVRRLLRDYPADRLFWVDHVSHETPLRDGDWPGPEIPRLSLAMLRRPNRAGLRWMMELGNWTFHAEHVAAQMAEWAGARGVEAVLGIGPGVSVWTSCLAARRLRVPLHLWVHDDPDAYAAGHHCAAPLRWHLRRRFRLAYREAGARYVISEPMREYYREQTGCDATVLPPSIGEMSRTLPNSCLRQASNEGSGAVRIGFAGSVTGTRAWEAFLRAMERLFAGGSGGRRPEITVHADPDAVRVPASVRERGWIRQCGWGSTDAVDASLAAMDYLYLPLDFDPSRRLLTATSLSTKFVSYLRVGVPILCHVPSHSAVARFVKRHPVGPLLDTMDIGLLAERLGAVFESRRDWQRRLACSWPSAVAEFDHKTLVERFHGALLAPPGAAACAGPSVEPTCT